MKKSLVLLAVVLTLAACGGGGDDNVPEVSYAQNNGTYLCEHVTTPGIQVSIKMHFTPSVASLTVNNLTYLYKDNLGEVSGQPRWSAQLSNKTDYESVVIGNDRTVVVYTGSGADFSKYYINKLTICKKV